MNQNKPPDREPLTDAFWDYLNGQLDAEQTQALQQALLADEQTAALCRDLADTMVLTQEAFQSEGAAMQELKHLTGPDLLQELARRESLAQAEVIDVSRQPEPAATEVRRGNTEPLTLKKFAAASGYLVRQGVFIKAAVGAGLAAAIMLALLWLMPWGDQPAAEVANESPTIQPSIQTVVATITGEQDAAWDRRPGEDLYTGQQFTLNAGFAEITTARGAIALLEAPATFELIDNDNGLRLHSGKLVGICQTYQSKGFVVSTPHLDVTDIGTRFGVTASETTSVHVIEGEVELTSGQAQRAVPLTAGQTATLNPETQRITQTESTGERFVTDWNAISSPPELTGEIRYEPAVPMDLRVDAEQGAAIKVFHERAGVQLSRPVVVSFDTPGHHRRFDQTARLEPGLTVDSYLIHYDPTVDTTRLPKTAQSQQVIVRFARPIVGVIATGDLLALSQDRLALPGVRYAYDQSEEARKGAGLEFTPEAPRPIDDTVIISDDRRTIELYLTAGYSIDQLRVLVQSPRADE